MSIYVIIAASTSVLPTSSSLVCNPSVRKLLLLFMHVYHKILEIRVVLDVYRMKDMHFWSLLDPQGPQILSYPQGANIKVRGINNFAYKSYWVWFTEDKNFLIGWFTHCVASGKVLSEATTLHCPQPTLTALVGRQLGSERGQAKLHIRGGARNSNLGVQGLNIS